MFSMFTGIGGFELAAKLINKDIELIGYSEIDKYAIEVFNKHFPGVKNYGDATRIDTTKLRKGFDLLTAGFPCQAFSIAGKRAGFSDQTRGTLFFDIARILADKRPTNFLLENVKGLLSHDSGKTFQTILRVLTDMGYRVEWQVLNSKNHGVPQNRERIFIIGHLGNGSGKQVFPLSTSYKEIGIEILGSTNVGGRRGEVYSTDGAVGALTATDYKQPKQIQVGTVGDRSMQGFRVYDEDGISCSITSEGGGLGQNTGLYQVGSVANGDAGRVFDPSGTSCTLKSEGGGWGGKTGLYQVGSVNNSQEGRVYDPSGVARTITGQEGGRGTRTGLYQVGNLQVTATKRTHETPKEINNFLKDNKGKYTLKQIAELIGIPKTQVEHYFRNDRSRSIPSPDVWLRLKDVLNFDDTYDQQVTEIYKKEVEFESTRRVYSADGISNTIDTGKTGLYQVPLKESRSDEAKQIRKENQKKGVDYSPRGMKEHDERTDGLANTITTNGNDNKLKVKAVLTPGRENKRQNGRRVKEDGEEMFTLTAQDQHGVMIERHNESDFNPLQPDQVGRTIRVGGKDARCNCHNWNIVEPEPTRIRRLTPTECERLQGFPDGWTEGLSDTQRYKTLGNAVTVNVVARILDELYKDQ